ncbi:MAG: hypothetical protein MHM6MM_001170 [Cercozoa sp. M6MM]
MELDHAFSTGQSQVIPTSGFFANAPPGRYVIQLDQSVPSREGIVGYQVNTETGVVRMVQRSISIDSEETPVGEQETIRVCCHDGVWIGLDPRAGKCEAKSCSTLANKEDFPDDVCSICLSDWEVAKPYKLVCGHPFHLSCLRAAFKTFNKCPTCRHVLAKTMGTMPPGTLSIRRQHVALAGHPNAGSFELKFDIPSGTQSEEHPNPGLRYQGAHRYGYLPDTPEGRKVLRMFKVAFRRRLFFKVGYSITRDIDNVVVWNGIHVKTNLHGGAANFGFPDATYVSFCELALVWHHCCSLCSCSACKKSCKPKASPRRT